MSFQDDLKETLMHHAQDVQTRPDTWDAVEVKVERGHRARLIATSTMVAAAIVAAAVVIPRLGTVPTDAPGFAAPGMTPSTGSTPGTTANPAEDGYRWFRDDHDAYQTQYKDEWRVTQFEGAFEFLPPGQIGLAAGMDTFAVEVQFRVDQRYTKNEDGITFTETTVAGQAALKGTKALSGGGNEEIYLIDWSQPYCETSGDCIPATLRIVVYGSTRALWASYADDGRVIVERLHATTDTAFPTGYVTTRSGVVHTDVAYDDVTEGLVRFLDDRVLFGANSPDYFLTAEARTDYEQMGTLSSTTNGDPWLTYTVRHRTDMGDGTIRFRVELVYAFGTPATGDTLGHADSAEVELITVGPGTTLEEARSATAILHAEYYGSIE